MQACQIAAVLGRVDYTNSRWTLAANIGSLTPGTHTVTAVAFDPLNASGTLVGSFNITVQ